MRDRLIKNLDGADLYLRNRAKAKPAPLNEYDIETMLDIAKVLDEAARALEIAIVPPCKVGEKVYVVAVVTKKILECTVIGAWITEGNWTIITDYGTICPLSCGDTVFLTREEAEQALKGGVQE